MGVPYWRSCFDDYLQNCSGDWPLGEYRAAIEKVERLLTGKTEGLMRDRKEEMAIASDALACEEAAKLRDSLHALQRYNQTMKIVDNSLADRDLFALDVDPDLGEARGAHFKIREGKLIGKLDRKSVV